MSIGPCPPAKLVRDMRERMEERYGNKGLARHVEEDIRDMLITAMEKSWCFYHPEHPEPPRSNEP